MSAATHKESQLSDLSDIHSVRFTVDLVSAARRNIGFLRSVSESLQWLHQTPTLVEAIRRYDELWMPLISGLTVEGSKPPMVLPPFDVEWIWFCHALNPDNYRDYCETRFSKIIGKPAIFDEENEEYALMRCRDVWGSRYPSESFENEAVSDSQDPVIVTNEGIFNEVMRQKSLCSKFLEPYMSETLYTIAARERYKEFLYVVQRLADGNNRLVPTLDIMLMWLTHQSYPTAYVEDMKAMDCDMQNVAAVWEALKETEFEETKKLWERTFDQPYEKAGGEVALTPEGVIHPKSPIYWEETEIDVNTKYKSMLPRFLLEVCMFVRLKSDLKATLPTLQDVKRNFLRLRVGRCHSELKLNKAFSSFCCDSWQKSWHLYCEFGTKGVILEHRRKGGLCLKGSILHDTAVFHWTDLVRASSLTIKKEVSQHITTVASITPPVQASYLLKCVPDRVTDDSGAMISDVILRMNSYHPQEGRWLSRTVLDHAGRECFVIRMRVGGGFWRRGGEAPSTVKWEDRIIEVREGSWSYVAGSIGRAPEKAVATATPKEPAEQWTASWHFSTGDELTVHWEPSTSMSGLCFSIRNAASPESSVKLLHGRQMQYRVKNMKSKSDERCQNKSLKEEREEEEDEVGFVTLVRYTEDNPNGKATALLNWKLLVVELLPEEDAVFTLLLCISILRSVSEMIKQDVGGLLIRRRLKEAKLGARDWGSVIVHPSSCSTSIASPYLQPWYVNVNAVMASNENDQLTKQPALTHSQVEGGDKLYKRGIIN